MTVYRIVMFTRNAIVAIIVNIMYLLAFFPFDVSLNAQNLFMKKLFVSATMKAMTAEIM